MNYIIWQSEPDAQKDVAQLVYNDVAKGYAIITTDCGRPQVIRISQEDLRKLLHHTAEFITDIELRKIAAEDDEEEYEKSEKDCMWERD